MRLMELIQPVQEIDTMPVTDGWFYGQDISMQEDGMQFAKKAKMWEGTYYYITHNKTFSGSKYLFTYSQDRQVVTGQMKFMPPVASGSRENLKILHPNSGARIDYVYVHRKYRGKGVANALYGILLDTYKILRSDGVQTGGGQRMWVSLHNKPGVTVSAALTIYPQFITNDLQKELDKLGAIKKSPNKIGKIMYEIPVDTSASMSRLVTNSRMLKLYNNDYFDIRLVAYKGKGAGRATT